MLSKQTGLTEEATCLLPSELLLGQAGGAKNRPGGCQAGRKGHPEALLRISGTVGLILPRASNITKGGWGVTFQNVPHCLLFSSNGTPAMGMGGHGTLSWDPAQTWKETVGSHHSLPDTRSAPPDVSPLTVIKSGVKRRKTWGEEGGEHRGLF